MRSFKDVAVAGWRRLRKLSCDKRTGRVVQTVTAWGTGSASIGRWFESVWKPCWLRPPPPGLYLTAKVGAAPSPWQARCSNRCGQVRRIEKRRTVNPEVEGERVLRGESRECRQVHVWGGRRAAFASPPLSPGAIPCQGQSSPPECPWARLGWAGSPGGRSPSSAARPFWTAPRAAAQPKWAEGAQGSCSERKSKGAHDCPITSTPVGQHLPRIHGLHPAAA